MIRVWILIVTIVSATIVIGDVGGVVVTVAVVVRRLPKIILGKMFGGITRIGNSRIGVLLIARFGIPRILITSVGVA